MINAGSGSGILRLAPETRPCFGIDLMDLPVMILPHPEPAFGPRYARVTAAARRRNRCKHTAGLRIDLLDATLAINGKCDNNHFCPHEDKLVPFDKRTRKLVLISIETTGLPVATTSEYMLLFRALDGYTLYSAHVGMEGIVASDEPPAGSFQKRSIFPFGTLPPVEKLREMRL